MRGRVALDDRFHRQLPYCGTTINIMDFDLP